jgi:glycosyltransferase involved in cell wall biosynthesis
VTILTATFPPWGGGGVIRMAKLAKYLPAFGWDVSVVCSDERNPPQRDDDLLSEIPESVRISRVQGPLNALGGRAVGAVGHGSGKAGSRIKSGLVRVARTAFVPDRWIGWSYAATRVAPADLGHPDVIVSSGPPHSAHLAASRIAKRLAIAHVIDLRDDWAGDPFGWDVAPWQGPLNRRLESRAVRRARAIVTVTEPMQRDLQTRYPGRAADIHLIPNGFDPADFEGQPPPRPSDAIEILYAGRLMDQESLGDLYAIVDDLAETIPLRLRLIGQVERQQQMALQPFRDRPWLSVQPPIAHHDAITAMRSASILLVATLAGGRGAAPNMTGKMFEYLAARRPILLIGPPSAASTLLAEANAGAAADPTDSGSIRSALVRCIQLARTNFDGASESLLRRFDRREQARQWAELLQAVVDQESLRI